MALVLADRVKETTTTTGTGTITLAGAVTGFRSFATVGNANTTYYTIAGQGTSEWEVGIGTYTASGTTLSRDTVLASSAGAPTKTNFSAGTKDVFVTYPSGRSVYVDGVTVNTAGLGAVQGDILYSSATDTFSRLPKDANATRYLANTGSSNNPAWSQINLANGVTGTLAATNGGTGQSSYAVGDLLFASTTTALSKLADIATGNALISGGVGVAPSYGKIGLTTHVSGTLPIANGGSGATTAQGGMNAFAGAVTSGQYLRGNGTNVLMSAIQAGDVPTLNQNTTGSAATVTGNATGSTFGFNSGYGSVATAYGCRAWVNFNGTGTVAIRASGNVSSITDNGVGLYTVNFTTAMPNTQYALTGSAQALNNAASLFVYAAVTDPSPMTTTSCPIAVRADTGTAIDSATISVAIFR
jgi:hypothetical protein